MQKERCSNNLCPYRYFSYLACFLISFYVFWPTGLLAQSNATVDKTIDIKAISGLKYDKVRLVAEPGTTIRINLENDDEMIHNLLIVKPGTRMDVVKLAESMGEGGTENSYVPSTSDVLDSTPLLDPGEEASVVFEVPEEEGVYPYVCTYPAHGMVMYGAIYVTNSPEELPPIEEDSNIPEQVRDEMAASSSMHPYPMEKPTLTRLFMPESSPAAIAVGMEKDQSYNWDAGYSFLRYAWDGGYIDASDQWNDKAHEVAKVVGDIYYRNTTGFPFRISNPDSVPEPDFQGYRMVDGYPQFKYKMGNITVHELILPSETTPGFQINYTLENVQEPIWYMLSDNDNISIDFSEGEREGNRIKLAPEEAKEFTISIVSDE